MLFDDVWYKSSFCEIVGDALAGILLSNVVSSAIDLKSEDGWFEFDGEHMRTNLGFTKSEFANALDYLNDNDDFWGAHDETLFMFFPNDHGMSKWFVNLKLVGILVEQYKESKK